MTTPDGTHVDSDEAKVAQARDNLLTEPVEGSWLPTRKWLAGLIGGLTPIVISAIESGWDNSETTAAVTLVSGLLVAYLVPNQPTAGGVPER